jgi:hypothetical protein
LEAHDGVEPTIWGWFAMQEPENWIHASPYNYTVHLAESGSTFPSAQAVLATRGVCAASDGKVVTNSASADHGIAAHGVT